MLKTTNLVSENIKVLVDMQALQGFSRFRGLGRFAKSFAKALIKTKGNNDVHLLFNAALPIEEVSFFHSLVGERNVHLFDTKVSTIGRHPHNHVNIPIAKHIYRSKVAEINPNILHIPSFFEGWGDECIFDIKEHSNGWKVVATLHDLIPLELPNEYLDSYPDYKEFYVKSLEEFKQINHFVSISEHSKQQAVQLLGISPNKITNCSSNIDEDFISTQGSEDTLQKYSIDKKYILYAGGSDARKNLPRLVHAFGTLPRQLRDQYQLVIVGDMCDNNAHILFGHYRQYVDKNEVRILRHVRDEDLVSLYRNASLFVLPSYSEGFGLPLVESMHFDTPIVCGNVSAMPEVVGFEECYFDPFSVDSIKNKMVEVLTNDELRQRIVDHGKQRRQHYSWDKTASKTWDVYTSIINSNNNNNINITSTKPQLFINVSQIVKFDYKTGIQRVVRSILNQLLSNPPEGYDVVPVYADTTTYGYKCAGKYINNNTADLAITFKKGDIFFNLDYDRSEAIFQFPLLKKMQDVGVKIYFFVHDMIPITHPYFFSTEEDSVYKKQHEEWIKVATSFDGAVCVSQFTADSVRKWCVENNTNSNVPLYVSWNGYDIESSSPVKGITPKQRIMMDKCFERQTLLMVGTIEPRKGHQAVINSLIKHRANILFVGKQGWLVDSVVESIRSNSLFGKRLFWISDASDECLEECYKKADGVIIPSYVEGFGLPIVEAAAYNKPIIARNIPVFKELIQDSAVFFNNDDELGDVINMWTSQQHKVMPSKVPLLTWKESTNRILSFIIPSKKDVQ